VKKTLFILTGLAALGSLGYFGNWVSAQNGVVPAAATEKPTLKIGVINIAKVLKNFDKANQMGEQLLAEAKVKDEYVQKQVLALQAEEQKNAVEADKAKAEGNGQGHSRPASCNSKIRPATTKRNSAKSKPRWLVLVHKDIGLVIDSLVKTYKLELVMNLSRCGRGRREEQARRCLPAPLDAGAHGLVHASRPRHDRLTIATLNKYFPKAVGTGPSVVAPGGSGTK